MTKKEFRKHLRLDSLKGFYIMKEQNKEQNRTETPLSKSNQETKKIGDILKKCRNSKHISVNSVSDYLAQNDFMVAPKTIYGWENGHSEPNAKILMLLCSLYEIDDILKTFGFATDTLKDKKKNILHLTKHEELLIWKYRQKPDIQPVIDKLLDM